MRTALAFLAIVGAVCAVSAEGPTAPAPTPYAVLGDVPYEYTGPRGSESADADLEEVRIGLFVPSDGLGPAIRKGAELAVAEANVAGGFNGFPYVLVERSADKTWGSAREVVDLAYGQHVWAIIGGADGESTHVAEQIATKAQLPLISPVTSEMSITQINIPWMFRVMPDDDRIARAIADHLERNELMSVTSLAQQTFDHRSRALAFAKELESRGGILEAELGIGENSHVQLTGNEDSVVVFADAALACEVLGMLENRDELRSVIVGVDSTDTSACYKRLTDPAVLFVWHPSNDRMIDRRFLDAFQKRFEETPGEASALAYDGVGVVIAAIGKAGLNRARIRDALAGMDDYVGVTGRVVFDGTGSRKADPEVRPIR